MLGFYTPSATRHPVSALRSFELRRIAALRECARGVDPTLLFSVTMGRIDSTHAGAFLGQVAKRRWVPFVLLATLFAGLLDCGGSDGEADHAGGHDASVTEDASVA